jgi:hypothetical protein
MDQDAYDDLLQRLTALVVKLDSTYDALLEANRQQQEFNRQQVAINRQLETVLERLLHQDDNGRDG